MHMRQQIRDGAAALLTGLSLTGNNVFTSRVRNVAIENLPALNITTSDEASEVQDMDDPAGLNREMEMMVEAIAVANTDVDDMLDSIAEDVEKVLGNNRELGGLVEDCWLQTTTPTFEGEGESLAGVLAMTFIVQYTTPINDPTITVLPP